MRGLCKLVGSSLSLLHSLTNGKNTMASMKQIQEYYKKTTWVQDTLMEMLNDDQTDEPEWNNLMRIRKTNGANMSALVAAMGGDQIRSVSFWVLKRTVDMDFNTMSKMVARKGL